MMYRTKLTQIWGNRLYWIVGLALLLSLIPTTTQAQTNQVDVVFVVDESGSMNSIQTTVKNNIGVVANGLSGSGIDGRFGLVGFGANTNHPAPGSPNGAPHIHTPITDLANFTANLNGLVNSGSYEPGFQATSLSTSNPMNFRPNAGTCIVLVSDEDADDPMNKSQAIMDLSTRNATFFGIVRSGSGNTTNDYGPDPGSLADVTGGQVFEITNFLGTPQIVLDALTEACVQSLDQVSGHKFNDLNGNGVHDNGEPLLSGWQIILVDQSGNIQMTTTDANGNYSFNNLTPGTYTVYEIAQPGWVQTAPANGSYTITVTQGQSIQNLDFGNKICEEGQPDLAITKSARPDPFIIGQKGYYILEVTNVGTAPFNGTAAVYDTIPDGLIPTSATPPCTIMGQDISCPVSVPLNAGDSQTFIIEVDVTAAAAPGVKNCATVQADVDADQSNNESCIKTLVPNPPEVEPDLGDAPDSTNHPGAKMSAYPGTAVLANYPTVYDDPTGVPGPIHLKPTEDSHLGRGVSGETDADTLPDSDGVTNIDPTSNQANRDKYDDGVHIPSIQIPKCGKTSFRYSVNVVGGVKKRVVNVWFDFNRDGDWDDVLKCRSGRKVLEVPEWAVQNDIISVGNGYHTLSTPTIAAMNPPSVERPMWMRITLNSGLEVSTSADIRIPDGRGPVRGYSYGETEDYLLMGEKSPEVTEGEQHIENIHNEQR